MEHRDLFTLPCLLTVILSFAVAPPASAETFVIKDGKPRAEIVIAGKSPRTVKLAAEELRTYLKKISGATLNIVTRPTGNVPVKVYVGNSPYTDRLGIVADGLTDGAYRMVSGPDWLALIGHDSDFTPREPWARSNTDYKRRMLAEWDKVTGDAKWACAGGSRMYKNYTGRARNFGKPKSQWVRPSGKTEVWAFDERGSFNAVCGFLRGLGVRWYMPGEIGEVVPTMATIALPKINETVRPDFPVRRFCFRFGVQPRRVGMWAMRLGVRDPYGLWVPHGMATMSRRPEFQKKHPTFFALYGGKRATDKNQLCLSAKGLVEENARFVRKVFDTYGFSAASVMPADGFTAICQCPLCEGKDTPERGYRGRMSDYVWDYVNRVAREAAKTHPDKKIICCAYGSYREPPLKTRLDPNVIVCIVGGRSPKTSKPEQQEEARKLRERWLKKTDNKILIFENYPLTKRGYYLPSFVPHVLGKSINAVKGISDGEDIWLSVGRNLHVPGYNHFNVYFTARMYWGGKRDVDVLFREYCRLFYGAAENEMRAFFEYCEVNWQDMPNDKKKIDRTFELFSAAERKVPADSVYGKRIALVADYLKALRNRGAQLGKPRGPVPSCRLRDRASGIRVDGKFDEPFWRYTTGRLKELQTGRKPVYATSFKVAWGKGNIYFAIRCEDAAGDKLNIGAKRNEDTAIWYGDVVEILLETDSHSYYQIAINPAGAMADMDWGAAKSARMRWASQAEVATQRGDGYWTIEARIPVVPETNDPFHQVVGRKPMKALPWHFNVCRQRIRENGSEVSAFSPTGQKRFHVPLKFGKLYVK